MNGIEIVSMVAAKCLSNYVICTSQRSGKTWLANTLRNLGFGHADEFVTALLRQQNGLDSAFQKGGLRGFMQRLQDLQDGRCCGLALAWNDFAKFSHRSGLEPKILLDRMIEEMGVTTSIISLRREDVIDQAISHYLMTRTGYRHSFDDEEKKIARQNVPFDRAAIQQEIEFAQKAYRGWDMVLEGRSFLSVTYEELVADPVATVRRAVEWIGGRASDRSIRKSLKLMTKVGDHQNVEMRAAFLRSLQSQEM
jgi:LPS sulfotransferase NodH